MPVPTWLIQIYEMTNEATQAEAVELFWDAPGLTADARTCEKRGWFLAVECLDATRALNIYEMVVLVDPHAELIHSSTGPALEREMV